MGIPCVGQGPPAAGPAGATARAGPKDRHKEGGFFLRPDYPAHLSAYDQSLRVAQDLTVPRFTIMCRVPKTVESTK